MRAKAVTLMVIVIALPIGFYALWLVHNGDSTGLVTVEGSELVVGGRPFTFLGANSFELWRYSLDEIRTIIDVAHEKGIRVLRVFLGGTAFESPLGVYNEWNLKKLDYVLAYCRLKGMYVIATLRDNNWIEDVYWIEPSGALNKTRMYADPEAMKAFKAFIAHVANRVNVYNFRVYKDDPTILAWDLCNEPDLGTDPQMLRRWVSEIASYLKSIDSKHLITVGLYDPQNAWVVYDVVDFISIHIYPVNGSVDLRTFDGLPSGKPIVLEEFGVEKGGLRDEEAELYRTFPRAARDRGFSGAMFWNLGLGNNPWDRWIETDPHIFGVIEEESRFWLVEAYRPSALDHLFFRLGCLVQFIAEESPYVTIFTFAVAALVLALLLALRGLRRSKGGEIPEKFGE